MQYQKRTPRGHGSAVQARPHVPMGDQRYQELMSKLGAAFAEVDDGEAKRQAAREKEIKRQEWLARRDAVIAEIVSQMRRYGISELDLA